MPANAPVTYFILFACCLVYGASLLLSLRLGASIAPQGGGLFGLFGIGSVAGQVLERLGASAPLPFDLDQPWRFVTACFLHANLMHIVFNMWVLVDIAPTLEELYGSSRFLFVYIVCGIGGYVLSSASLYIGILRALGLASSGLAIGASGAIVGLIGVLLAITYRRSGAAMEQLRRQVVRWIIYLAIFGFVVRGIDNMAHLGGGLTGFMLGKMMLDREPQAPEERKHAYALGWGAALVIVLSFGLMIFGSRIHLLLH